MTVVLQSFQQHCLIESCPNNSCVCVRMAPFRVLIEDYWARSDGSSLLANTWEEVAANTTFSVRLLFQLEAREPLTHSYCAWWCTSVPLAFLPPLNPRDLAESTKSTLQSKEGKYPAAFASQMCAISGDSDLSLNGNSVVSFLSCNHQAVEQRVRPLSSR